MPPHVPTLPLHGNHYNIGLQHGQQAKDRIHNNLKTYATFFRETAGLSWSEARTRSEVFVPTLQKLYPAILDEIRGIADGSGLEFADILALNVRSEIALTNYENAPKDQGQAQTRVPEITDGCTSLAQLSADKERLVVAQNWDWLPELAGGMVVLAVTISESSSSSGRQVSGSEIEKKFFTLTEAGLVGKIGLNSSGLAICLNALRCGAFDASRLPTHIMTRYILEHTSGFDAAVEAIREIGGASTANMLMGDVSGRFGTVEVTPLGISVLEPASSPSTPGSGPESYFDLKSGKGPLFIAHTNHVVTPPTAFPRGAIYDRPAPNSFARLERITELARGDAQGGVRVCADSVYARLKDQKGDPTGICRGIPANARGMERMTTLASVIVELDIASKKLRGSVTAGRPCEEGLQRIEWVF
ncbi:acyl-coenzyme A:6-aminopenicillanic acid acyl-transferase-domain-containing protein [Aspergillus multicolor]|uniref:acyl-coenzyme A:6-aminopenicillanic acid acyl-transferase-domain-containing protein n=1 Tax=Aspergillus multicolor TaxID=41759 RepID=UPI003CCDE6DA